MILPQGSGGTVAKVYDEANAHLIASAPNLYEALRFFVCQLEPWVKLCPKLAPWVEAARDEGNKALAKAEDLMVKQDKQLERGEKLLAKGRELLGKEIKHGN